MVAGEMLSDNRLGALARLKGALVLAASSPGAPANATRSPPLPGADSRRRVTVALPSALVVAVASWSWKLNWMAAPCTG